MDTMTQTHHAFEKDAKESARALQLWLATIAPVDGKTSLKVQQALADLAVHVEWPTQMDPNIGIKLIDI